MGILRTDKISGLETPTAVTGSVSFDGDGDYLIADTNLTISNSNFTLEAWVNMDWTSQDSQITGSSNDDFNLFIESADGDLKFYDGASAYTLDNSHIPKNTWTHIAIVREGTGANETKVYVNGLNTDSITVSKTWTSTIDIYVGRNSSSGTSYANGYISNLRILKGTALYTSNFTPPTHELEKIGDTVLLCCNNPDSAGAEATGKTITVNGDAAASTFSPGLTRDFTFGTQFEGVTRFDTQGYFVPPSGTTEQRGRGRGVFGAGTASPGSSNLNSIEYIQIQTQGNAQDFGDLAPARAKQGGGVSSSTRGITGGGFTSVNSDKVEFIIISTTGNALDYGDLSTAGRNIASASNSTRGIFAGGDNRLTTIDFLTIESGGLAASFGSLPSPGRSNLAGCASPTRALFGGGYSSGVLDTIEHVTIATTGSLQDFGNLSVARFDPAPCSSSTRGIFAGGATPSPSQFNTIDFVTIATLGNAQDFGDLIVTQGARNGTSNSVRGVFAGGTPSFTNTIDFITIASTGDAQDFGDLIVSRSQAWSCSDSHGGIS